MEPPPVQYVTTSDGYSIAYGIAGEGMPLVSVPIMSNHFSLQWSEGIRRAQFESFASRFKLVLYDSRGQGLSTRGLPDSLTVDDFVLDLESVVDRLGLARFVLYAPVRGIVALRYAVKHPERVATLVLWNYIDARFAQFAFPLSDLATHDWEALIDISARFGFPESDTATVKRVMRVTSTPEDFLAQVRVVRGASAEDILREVAAPTLLIAARTGTGPFPAEESGKWAAALMPNARLMLIDEPGGGLHAVDGKEPPAVTAIADFVAGLPSQIPAAIERSRDGLSPRELEVLRLIAEGKSNRQIAAALVISPNTVGRHVGNIFSKIGVANRAEATSYAHRNRLI